MKKILVFWFSLLIIFFGFVFVQPVLADKMKAGEIDALLNDEKTELQVLRKKIARQERAISKAGAKESVVLKILRKIGSQLLRPASKFKKSFKHLSANQKIV